MTDERVRVIALLKRYGWNATSFQILEPGFQYWFDSDDACVGYVDTGRAWVAAGAPIAAPERLAQVTEAFVAAAAKARRRVCCFATESRFHDIGWASLRIGDQPSWAPADWNAVVRRRASLREQLRRARAKGVTVRSVAHAELEPGQRLRLEIDGLIARWLVSRPIAPMGFLVQVDPFAFPEERRYFVAEREGHAIGFLGIIPIYQRSGWFFEDFLRDPAAPNGTVELLIDAGMRAADAERIPYVTLGLVPLSGDVGPWLRAARRFGKALYDFDGLRAFKAKLEPRAWDPIFLSYPAGGSGFLAIADTLKAFARGGLLRFGLETFMRGPAIVMRMLAVLLLAFTIVLALPQTAPWFPSAACRWGWVAFDVVIGASLLVLSNRWRRGLANILAGAVTLDAVATLAQAITYNLPRRQGVLDVVVIVIAVLAPTLAALMLWNAKAAR